VTQPPPPTESQQKLTVPQAFGTATSLHRQGRLREAEQVYRAILQLDRNHVGSLHYLGVICNQHGRPDEAERLVRQALALNPRSAEACNDLGIVLAALGRHQDAIVEYQKAVAAKSDFHEAYNNLGTALQALDQHEQAIVHFEKALAVSPSAAEVHNNLGMSLAALHRWEESAARFERAVALRPGYAEAHSGLAHALAAVNRREAAIAHFQTALALKPDVPEGYNDLGNALAALDRFAEAIAQYQKALALKPDFAETYNNLGSALAGLERHPEAIAAYQRAIALRPDFVQAHYNLGKVFAALDRHDEAIAQYQKAIALKPNFGAAYCSLGSVLAALGRPEEAIANYQKALAIDPDGPDLHHSLGYALQTIGRLDQSRRAFAKAVALAPRRADLYRGLAESKSFSRGDPHLLAMEQLAQDMASLTEKEQMELHFALGSACEDLGQHERAFDQFLKGNALKRRQIGYDEAAAFRMFERIATAFTPELMHRNRAAGNPSPAPVFIVGMPRSGTTLVEQLLASHPRVFGAGERKDFSSAVASLSGHGGDSPSFPELLSSLAGEEFRHVGTRYLDGIAALAPAAERITDKMPANFRFAGLIHLALPNARIIHARRDPVDTCLSCFSKLFAGKQPYSYELGELGRYYRAYEGLMEHWRRVLPEGVMLEVRYEDLVADFERQARRIVAHCGLAWDDACLAFHTTQRPVRTASATQVRQPIYQRAVGRWRPYARMLGPLLKALGMPEDETRIPDDAKPKPGSDKAM
jgi:tetratricopeptide (TPR) repeat protein